MRLFFFLLTVNYALSQTDSSNDLNTQVVRPAIRQYLQLSADQVTAIAQNIDEHDRWTATKLTRMQQVKFEITAETKQSTLDPMALGVRYAEIEAICRDMRDQTARLGIRNLSVLTDNQKKRLAALNDVLKLMPVVLEAQDLRLMDGERYGRTDVPVIWDPLTSIGFGIGSFLLPRSNECGIPQTGLISLPFTPLVRR